MVSSNLLLERRISIERVDREEEFLAENPKGVDFYKSSDGKYYCVVGDEGYCINDYPDLLNTIKIVLKGYLRGPLKKNDNQR